MESQLRPLAAFFAQFPEFNYNPRNSPSAEIRRLKATTLWWSLYGDDDDALFDAYRDALTKEFNARYGTNADDLASWQALCRVIGFKRIPDTVQECRKLVCRTHVNIVDLIHVHETGGTVTIFRNLQALRNYTIDNGKYFPRRNANAGNLLKYLLRDILGN